ncbi:unnamed protein product [Brachionus calyciflorus]|uniref:Anti-proliferative protein domain-containing protein n=1 Tax=Brachionus calyciflorus TaxID=104777 RepID=A0A813Q9B2_9BILA|nr:unnamed protein product [Brachionus calyciflorus]
MKEEIEKGVTFLRQFLAKYGQLNPSEIDLFASKLSEILEKRYMNHWYESNPMKGQAFRCLRLKKSEKYVDPTIEAILNEMNLSLNQLGLPNDFTLWIDPGEVSVRFGDSVGYTYTIAKLTKNSPPETTNSEKIFDDNLTAFIRQNSSNNQSDVNEVSFNLSEMSLNDIVQSNLPIEKRTISPPLPQKRNNSSNMPINNLTQNRLSFNDSSCYFSSSSSSCASSFGSEDYSHWFNNNSELFQTDKENNLSLLNFDFNSINFNSETSSERSDTPNSCVTNSSYFSNFNNFAFDGLLFPSESLDSSVSSVTTITPESDVQTPKKVSDSEEEKIKKSPKVKKEAKNDQSYCGYVESFPYYYKLNRLYNALAVQKMQTERLRKAGLLSPANMNNPVAVAQAIAAYNAINPLATSPGSTTPNHFGSSSPPGIKPKQKNYKNYKKYHQYQTQSQQQQQQQQHQQNQQQQSPISTSQLQQQAQTKFY